MDLYTDLDYATARAYEQFYIEKYDTIDTANPKANQQNSFRHIRAQNPDDKRGIAFESEYKKIKYN